MMISLKAAYNTPAKIKADAIAFLIFEDKKILARQINSLRANFKSIAAGVDAGVFTAKFQETLTLFPSERKMRLLLIGLGKREKFSAEKLRRAGATAAKLANSLKARSLAILEPEDFSPNTMEDAIGVALSEGAALSQYRYDKYMTGEKKNKQTLRDVSIVTQTATRKKALSREVARARVLCETTLFARDLGNAPPNEIYPESLALRARASARKNKISVKILDEKKIKKLRMGGVIAVAQGSDRAPRFIVMEYNNRRSLPTIVLVGKGVTFDAGGISIKPAAGMSEMKMDMCGAAAVIATMEAVARLKLPLHVVALIPSVENLLGASAMKPGDIIMHLNGKTSEVDNTDAEGRLILADALSYASRYKPDLVVDLATLTGAVVVGLGSYATGMMGNDDVMMDRLKQSGERTYERVWQLPMFEEYEKLNKSDVADVKNSGGRQAGTITAAFFLKQFIGKYKWVHLDIAGTAILSEALDYTPRGASGVGVRLLVDFLSHWKN